MKFGQLRVAVWFWLDLESMKQRPVTDRSLAPGFTRAQALANTERVFEEAFGSSRGGSPEEDAMVDRVEYAPEGLRISYSRPTAEWLTSVTERPQDFGLVYNFLVEEILGCASHPLGLVVDEFVSLMSLFSPGDSSGGWDDSPESEESASPDPADAQTPLAAQCMKIGVTRLHGLVSAVLPQLQHNPGRSFALAAVEAVLFDRCSAVLLTTLLGGASGEDDSRCEFLELEALLPRHLGVRQAFWLEAEEAETPRGRTPRGRTPRSRRSAAGGGAAEQEAQERLGQDVDAQLPYAHAIVLVQALPLLAAPRQKLQLFCDACAEAQRCVARHHEAAEVRRREAQPQHAPAAGPAAAAEAEAGAVGGAPAAAAGPEAMALGAEDLIPVMAYVLLRAKLCHLDTQLRLIEVFVDCPSWQAALLGPLGYSLATLQAATQLLLSFCRTARGDATPATPATPAPPAPPAASPRGATSHRAGYHRIGVPLAPASSPANGAAHFGSPGCDKRSSPSLRERARLAKRSLCSGGGAAAASIVGALVTEPAHLGALRAHLGASRSSKGAPDARLPAGRVEAVVPVHIVSGDNDDASDKGASSGACAAAHLGGAVAVAALRVGRLSAARKLGSEERQSPRILASPAPRTPVPRIWARARASPGGVPTRSGGNAVTAAAPATSVAASPAATQPLPTAGLGPDLPDAPDAPAPATPKGARPNVGVPDGTRAAYSLSLPMAVMLPAAEETPPASERGSLTRRGGGRRRQYYDASNNPEVGSVTCRDAGDAETENQSPSTIASMVGARLPPQVPATTAETAARAGGRPTSAGAEGDGPRHTPCKPRRKQYIGDQTPNAEDQTCTSPTP